MLFEFELIFLNFLMYFCLETLKIYLSKQILQIKTLKLISNVCSNIQALNYVKVLLNH